MQAEFAVDPVVCDRIRPECFCHTAVRVCFPDRAEKAILLHQSADLFQVHPDPLVEQAHMDAACPFGITTVAIGGQDQLEISFILSFTSKPSVCASDPVIVSGS